MPGALGGGQGFVWNLGAKKELHPLLISIPMKFANLWSRSVDVSRSSNIFQRTQRNPVPSVVKRSMAYMALWSSHGKSKHSDIVDIQIPIENGLMVII